MTREEAISLIKSAQLMLINPTTNEPVSDLYAALDMAIQALSQEPQCTEYPCLGTLCRYYKEPCEDAVSRDWLKTAIHNFYYGLKHTPTEEDIQAYIDAAPSVTQKPIECDDAISREAAIEAVKQAIYNHDSAIMRLTELPSVTQKSGKWIDREVYDTDRWKCSACGRTEPYREDYCPNCGAKMESEVRNDNNKNV